MAMRRLVRSFFVAAKPIGSRCNIDCTYCYYLHKQGLLADDSASPITDGLLEEFIRQHVAGQDTDIIEFTWHGGEPTLLGLDFFRKVIRIQARHAGDKHIENDLQTNGLLLDDEWCEFLKENEFFVGLSIDGPKHLHDRYRVTRGGASTFDKVYSAARLLQRHNIPFSALAVVNAVNARHPEDVYRFLTEDLGCHYIQWSPCVEPRDFHAVAPGHWNQDSMPPVGSEAARPGRSTSVVTDWSVDPDDFGDFLCRTFDLWRENDLGRVYVNWFESAVGQWMNKPAQLCTMAETCGRCVALEKDGAVYSCDHFVYPEYQIGMLSKDGPQLADMVYSPEQRKFGCNKRDTLTDHCKKCDYRFACNGDCPKNRFTKSPDGQPGLSYLCPGLKRFFAHADPHLRQIAAQIRQLGDTSHLATPLR
ncbi:Anaerobic sulfatase-maturating enzyme [Posidoniimonas corsicana]|uniref:Anaerobic sulfatase-maturating enzyme n=1 Tax=Posidoniimonas corsicana TaxID=1938618 RepID=A0A5C5VH01_9BACT|nr:anaerobic sulfatase maturase [Posidoniimonas corsicana]TWT37189.1 Anaerobic sulfatase-maturating enzyme [Posidoniimonas corsicana]